MKKRTSMWAAAGAVVAWVLTGTLAAPTTQAEDTDPALTQTVSEEEPVAQAGTPVEISSGHVDMGPKMVDGTWELMIRDDSATPPTWRHLDDVVFRVSDTGKMQIPDSDEFSFLDASQAWVIPQQQIPDVVWLGWNTQDPPVASGVNGGVDLVYEGHQGPGHFAVFVQAGNFSGPDLLWDSNTDHSQPIHVDLNTHTHANWVFTEPGVHLVRISASAQLKDGSTVSDAKVLRFAVGDRTSTDQARTIAWERSQTDTASGNGSSDQSNANTSATNQNSSQVVLWISAGLAVLVIAIAVILLLRSRAERATRLQAAALLDTDSERSASNKKTERPQ